jgi:hypothetical protein
LDVLLLLLPDLLQANLGRGPPSWHLFALLTSAGQRFNQGGKGRRKVGWKKRCVRSKIRQGK